MAPRVRSGSAPPKPNTEHFNRSMFGRQNTSNKTTAPAFGFGTSTRAHTDKVYLSQEHAKTSSHGSPAAPGAYNVQASVGPNQVESRKTSAPTWGFGTADRFTGFRKEVEPPGPGAYEQSQAFGTQINSSRPSSAYYGFGSSNRGHYEKVYMSEEHGKSSRYGRNSPGPNYKLKGTFDRQDETHRGNPPAYSLGLQERFQYEHVKRAATSPGPGAYRRPSGVGPQVQSNRPSSRMYGFGSSNRDHQQKVYISQEHEKTCYGRNSPAPGTYTIGSSTVGKQSLSQNHTSANWGFGSADRWKDPTAVKYGDGTPGPGAYCI